MSANITTPDTPRVKTRIRAAETTDLNTICALLRQELPGQFSSAQWMQLFEHNWSRPPYYGHVLATDDNRIVGFIGAIVVERRIDGMPQTLCNLTSWCVQQDFRGDGGLMMLMPYLRRNDWTITTITPAPIVVELFEKLGFKYYDSEKLILPALWNLRPGDLRPLRVIAGSAVLAALAGDERQMLEDHLPHGCNGYLFEAGGQRAFFITKKRNKRGMPLTEILHCGNPGFFGERLERIKLGLMVRERTLGIMCDGRMIQHRRPWAIRLKRVAMIRSKQIDGLRLDNLYTERVLLPV